VYPVVEIQVVGGGYDDFFQFDSFSFCWLQVSGTNEEIFFISSHYPFGFFSMKADFLYRINK
jgi:hypothetical protein